MHLIWVKSDFGHYGSQVTINGRNFMLARCLDVFLFGSAGINPAGKLVHNSRLHSFRSTVETRFQFVVSKCKFHFDRDVSFFKSLFLTSF